MALATSIDVGRIRKPIEYVRHYVSEFRNVLESGDIILVEPSQKLYAIHPQYSPIPLVEKLVNCVDRFSSPLPKLTATSASKVEKAITELDVRQNQLAYFKVYCYDPGFQAKIAQPQTAFLWDDRQGARRLSYANSMMNKLRKEFAMLPDIWIISNQNPLLAEVTSTNMFEDQNYARLGFVGFRYQLIPVTEEVGYDDPRIIMTIRTGVEQTT